MPWALILAPPWMLTLCSKFIVHSLNCENQSNYKRDNDSYNDRLNALPKNCKSNSRPAKAGWKDFFVGVKSPRKSLVMFWLGSLPDQNVIKTVLCSCLSDVINELLHYDRYPDNKWNNTLIIPLAVFHCISWYSSVSAVSCSTPYLTLFYTKTTLN